MDHPPQNKTSVNLKMVSLGKWFTNGGFSILDTLKELEDDQGSKDSSFFLQYYDQFIDAIQWLAIG
jgi:hypothetical protein